MNVKTDLATSIHFDSLAVQLRQLQVHGGVRVGCWDLESQVELPLDQVLDNPALAGPHRAIVIGLNLKPIVVLLFVHPDVVDEQRVFFLQALDPIDVSWPSHCVDQR